ncbi:MAG: tetraacyldisaccharide 4'-kinase [Lentisphaerae bacterium]|nr:tetraacyldisaccharide 4'-kinase [Lentisphaerota bacterium]
MGLSRGEKLERFYFGVIYGGSNSRLARVMRKVFGGLSYVFAGVVTLRHFLYAKGFFRHHTLGCQVISIGNLTVGGTGKTPVVEVFARALQREGRKVAILSRGYKKVEHGFWKKTLDGITGRARRRPPRVVSNGRELLLDSSMSGDEPYMLASNLRDVVILVDKNRVKSGRYAIDKTRCDTLILDDGFQYLALKHRVEIVLVDCTNPFSNGYMLPRGLLREPAMNIRRADFIFITKSDGGAKSAELKERLRRMNPRAEISECLHKPQYLCNVYAAERRELDFLRGQRVAVVSGIASPDGFEGELRQLGAEIVYCRRFADHHRYTQQEVIDLINAARRGGAAMIVTTEKDAVRFPKIERLDVPVYFLRVEVQLLSGMEDFNACISRICFRT